MAGLKRQATFIQRKTLTPPASICHRYLPLLGYPEVDYVNKDLFVQPNHKAFNEVMYFLLEILDKERCRKDFRDCYPVIDKKIEALFCQAAYSWYSELAAESKNGLYTIHKTLFSFPGGAKFLEFMNHFVRFVAVQNMKEERKKNPLLSGKSNNEIIDKLSNIRDGKSMPKYLGSNSSNQDKTNSQYTQLTPVLKKLIISNMSDAQSHFAKLNETYEEAKQLMDRMTEKYRKYQEEQSRLIEEEKQLTLLINQNIIKKSQEAHNEKSKSLKAMQTTPLLNIKCCNLKEKASKKLNEFCDLMASMDKHLGIIKQVLETTLRQNDLKTNKKLTKRQMLNVFEYDANAKVYVDEGDSKTNISRSLPCLIEKFTSVVNTNESYKPGFQKAQLEFPIEKVITTANWINSYKNKLCLLEKSIENTLKEAEGRICEEEKKLRNVDWASIYKTRTNKEGKLPNIWDEYGGPLLPPELPIEFEHLQSYGSGLMANDEEETWARPFLLSKFGTKQVWTDDENESSNTSTSFKLDDSVSLPSPVMSSTVMHSQRKRGEEHQVEHQNAQSISALPLSPISPPETTRKPDVNESNIEKEGEKEKILTAKEVCDRMNEYISGWSSLDSTEIELNVDTLVKPDSI